MTLKLIKSCLDVRTRDYLVQTPTNITSSLFYAFFSETTIVIQKLLLTLIMKHTAITVSVKIITIYNFLPFCAALL